MILNPLTFIIILITVSDGNCQNDTESLGNSTEIPVSPWTTSESTAIELSTVTSPVPFNSAESTVSPWISPEPISTESESSVTPSVTPPVPFNSSESTVSSWISPEPISTESWSTVTPTVTPTPSCDANCTFKPDYLTTKTLKQWPKLCHTVCTDLNIGVEVDLTEAQLTSAFKNLKRLIGGLVMMRTKFTSAKFLAGLESVECDNSVFMFIINPKMTEIGMTNLTSVSCRIQVSTNVKMTRLGLPNLKKLVPLRDYAYMAVDIQNLSPDFCVTIQEMKNFLDNRAVKLDYIPGKYCPLDSISDSNSTEKVCDFGNTTLSELEDGCVHLKGDVIVEAGEEEHVEKLESVRNIFGSLIIDGTNLTGIDFLGDLEYVAALQEDSPAIQVYHNLQLSNVSFPSLKRVRSYTRNSIVFQNNSKVLLSSPTVCYDIRNSLGGKDNWAPTFDGESCEWIETNAIILSRSGNSPMASLTILLILYVII